MKLHVLSDLHLSVCPMDVPRTDADVVILAGDVHRPAVAAEWARGFRQPVLYVLGNHEYFGASVEATRDGMRRLCVGSNIRLLDNEVLELGGVRFLGSVLWSDFRINGAGAAEQEARIKAAEFAYDFKKVQIGNPPHTLTPQDTQALFAANVAWLEAQLNRPYPGPTVVITHHAPSPGSIHPRFAGSPLNGAFVSDVERLMDRQRVRLWIHGHVHDSFDYEVNGTRVLCNPRGYVKGGKAENPDFDPRLVIEIA